MKGKKNYYLGVTVPDFSKNLANSGLQKISGKLLRLIEDAQEEILIFGYRITELPDDIEEALKAKSNLVEMVVGNLDEDVEALLARLEIKDENVGYFRNSKKKSIDKSIYHIKCMLIDRKKILVGSANFTYSAMEKNIEISILILDDMRDVKKIKNLHNELIEKKELLPL